MLAHASSWDLCLVQASSVALAPPGTWAEAAWQSHVPGVFPPACAHGVCAGGEAGRGTCVGTEAGSSVLGCLRRLRWDPAQILTLGWCGSSCHTIPLVLVMEQSVLQLRFPPWSPRSPAQDPASRRSEQRFHRNDPLHFFLGQRRPQLTCKQVRPVLFRGTAGQ